MTPLTHRVITLGGTVAGVVALISTPILLAAAVAAEWWATRGDKA